MSAEGIQALLTEQERLNVENAALRGQVAQLAELEQRNAGPQAFVKPDRPKPGEPKGPRKKRAAEHNTSRKRAEPTRIERHVLAN